MARNTVSLVQMSNYLLTFRHKRLKPGSDGSPCCSCFTTLCLEVFVLFVLHDWSATLHQQAWLTSLLGRGAPAYVQSSFCVFPGAMKLAKPSMPSLLLLLFSHRCSGSLPRPPQPPRLLSLAGNGETDGEWLTGKDYQLK